MRINENLILEEGIMAIQSEMPCWEIMQCNKKQICFFAGDEKRECWELVQENDAHSFHICADCLVYQAKHPDSTLTEEEFCFIMEQRKNTIQREWVRNPLYMSIAPVFQTRCSLKRRSPIHHEEISI
jgi:hypothetical protein